MVTHLLLAAQHLSLGGRAFAGVYLLSYGVLKVGLVWALLKSKLWAYPASISIFTAFGLYQIYRFILTRSVVMFGLTVLDVAVIVLTWMEYQRLRHKFTSTGRLHR